jgi:hypothetical protein
MEERNIYQDDQTVELNVFQGLDLNLRASSSSRHDNYPKNEQEFFTTCAFASDKSFKNIKIQDY